MMPPPVPLDALRAVLEGAGRIIGRHYDAPGASTRKGDGSPLTAADTEANQFLRERLLSLLPAAGWLSEESRDDSARLGCEWVWVVDPLDGTKEFVRRIPELAISIGLAHRGQAVLGGVFNPVSGEGGVGVVGGEWHCWGFANTAPAKAECLAQASAGVSRTEVEDGSIVPWLGLVREPREIGSVAYKLLRVAARQEDLTFTVQPKSEWDICGGVALLRAAGLCYLRFDGQPGVFNQPRPRIACGAVAGPRALADELLRRVTGAAEAQPA